MMSVAGKIDHYESGLLMYVKHQNLYRFISCHWLIFLKLIKSAPGILEQIQIDMSILPDHKVQ